MSAIGLSPDDSQYVTFEEAAALRGVSLRVILRAIVDGRLRRLWRSVDQKSVLRREDVERARL